MSQTSALFNSLGLSKVEADPNKVPDGTYDGEILKSELVLVPAKKRISHVVTYKVTEGTRKGAQVQDWNEVASDPLDANGQPAQKLDEVVQATPSMKEESKPWYKKRICDCTDDPKATEKQIDEGTFDIGSLTGTPVTFGLKTKDGFQNVNFARKRSDAPAPAQPVSLADLGASPAQPATAPVTNAEAPAGLAPVPTEAPVSPTANL